MPTGTSLQRALDGEAQAVQTDMVPTKRDLSSWWKNFKRTNKKEDEKAATVEDVAPPSVIFGVPLQISILYANVAISLFDNEGESFIYGYVPIVVAKCGVFLKEKATEIEGIFRLAGAERRIKELQAIFNSPDRYGKGLDWSGYTVHDAANVLRRYINQLPEPIVPREFYARFREPLFQHQAQAVGEKEGQRPDIGTFDLDGAIKTYQQLITEIPALNRQLLLYLLDLLAVFAAKAEVNLMTAHNLSSIFQPGLIHDPKHNLSPMEYRLNQDVLIFLIEKQDHFLVGMQGTAADEQTIQEVESGAPSPQIPSSIPTTPKTRTAQLLGRSASTTSVGSESARRFGALRRNLSVSSRNSRQSNNAPSPITPPSGNQPLNNNKVGGIHRSNTVPSKKSPSPALASDRFQAEKTHEGRIVGSSSKTSPLSSGSTTPGMVSGLAPVSESPVKTGVTFASSAAYPPTHTTHSRSSVGDVNQGINQNRIAAQPSSPSPHLSPSTANAGRNPSQDRISVLAPTPSPHLRPSVVNTGRTLSQDRVPSLATASSPHLRPNIASTSRTSSQDRISAFFKQPGGSEVEKKDGRKPNKLQKKRAPEGIATPGSSTQSLGGGSLPVSPAFPPQAPDSRRGSSVQGDGQQQDGSIRAGVFDRRGNTHSPHRHSTLAVSAQPGSDVATAHEATSTAISPDNPVTAGRSPTGSLTSSGNDYSSPERVEEAEQEKIKEKKRRWRISSPGKKTQKQANGVALEPIPFGNEHGAQRSTSTVGSMGRSRKSMTDESYTTNASAKAGSSNEMDERMGSVASVERKGAFGWFKDKLQRAKSPTPQGAAGEFSASKQSLNAVMTNSDTSQGRGRSVEAFGEH